MAIFQKQKRKRLWELKDGIFRSYFKNGRLRVEAEAFKNAQDKIVITGCYKAFWSNGRQRLEGVVKARKWVGQVKVYNRLGVLTGVYDGKACLGKNEEEYFMGKSW